MLVRVWLMNMKMDHSCSGWTVWSCAAGRETRHSAFRLSDNIWHVYAPDHWTFYSCVLLTDMSLQRQSRLNGKNNKKYLVVYSYNIFILYLNKVATGIKSFFFEEHNDACVRSSTFERKLWADWIKFTSHCVVPTCSHISPFTSLKWTHRRQLVIT